MRHPLVPLAAAAFLFSVAAIAETSAPAADAAKKLETAKKTSGAIASTLSKDPVLNPLNEAAYKARTQLEIALKKIDPEFAATHADFAKAREKHTADRKNEEMKKAYYAAQDKMVAEMAAKAKGNEKVKAQYDAWIAAQKAVEDKMLELLKAKNPTKAALYEEALKTVRETR